MTSEQKIKSLTNSDKIDILNRVIEVLQDKSIGYIDDKCICYVLEDVLKEEWHINIRYTKYKFVLDHFGLSKYKPEPMYDDKMEHWFKIGDIKSRVELLNKRIKELKNGK